MEAVEVAEAVEVVEVAEPPADRQAHGTLYPLHFLKITLLQSQLYVGIPRNGEILDFFILRNDEISYIAVSYFVGKGRRNFSIFDIREMKIRTWTICILQRNANIYSVKSLTILMLYNILSILSR